MHISGPRHHGVVRHARAVAALVAAEGAGVVGSGPADLTHAQFSDTLWGPDVATAAGAYERWSSAVPHPLVVTLHDVPGSDPDPAREARRREGYRRVLAASDGVIVSSRHEATKAAELTPHRPRVIELPLPAGSSRPATGATVSWGAGPTLGLLGFLYPGKGHAEVIAAAGRRAPAPRVVSLGAVSTGHQSLRRDLALHADRHGVELVVTGALSDIELTAAMAAVTVPLVPGRLVSASASLVTWVGHGRRPLVAAGAYADELAARHAGIVARYDGPDELDAAIEGALSDPLGTRLEEVPSWPDVGGEHLAAYRDLLGRAGVTPRPPPA
jgi:hypothetical protein